MKITARIMMFVSACCLMAASAMAQGTGESMKVPSKEMGTTASPYSNNSGTASISQVLAHNPKLAEKLQSMLPQGTDVAAASHGFLEIF